MAIQETKFTPYEVVEEFMNRFSDIYSGHEDLAMDVFRKVVASQLGLKENGKPVASYMLVGPTGSGKSYFWECIAWCLHQKRGAMLYLDGGEFIQSHNISKIIGAPPGFIGHNETDPVISRKSLLAARGDSPINIDLILFDEIDKAHHDIQTLFLGILERATMRTGLNKEVDLNNAIIAFTSNAVGSATKKGDLGLISQMADSIDLRKSLLKDFSAPFINRIEEFRYFREYTREEKRNAMILQADSTLDSFGDFKSGWTISECFFDEMLDSGLEKDFGMRNLIRHMKTIIRNKRIDGLLGMTKKKYIIGADVKAYLEHMNNAVKLVQANVC